MPAPDHVLLFDADCGFCTRSLDRIMRRDRDGRVRAVPIQSAEGERLLASVPEGERLDSWHLVGPDGAVRSAGAAAPELLRLLRGGRLPAALTAAMPTLTDLGYRLVARHRGAAGRFLMLALSVFFIGCGSAVEGDSELAVYIGAAGGADARDVADGAALALEQAGGEAAGATVRLELVDEGRGEAFEQSAIAAGARRAAEDSQAIGYIGELSNGATLVSAPITNAAGILQVAPGPIAEKTLEADGDSVPTASQPSGQRTLGALLAAGGEPLSPAGSGAGAGFAARFEAATGRAPGPFAAYGHEAMAVILDSIDRAGDPLDRESVSDAYLDTADRESVLGVYSVGNSGLAGLPPG